MAYINKWSKRLLSWALAAALLLGMLPAGARPASAAETRPVGTDYYVDALAGNDANVGTSESAPWRSLHKLNNTEFQPGDVIYMKRGSVWEGQLWPKGSGAEGSPIVIMAYGAESDPRPLINGNALAVCEYKTDKMGGAVMLKDQQYWEINDLEITNRDSANTKQLHGVALEASVDFMETSVEHIYLNNLYIHDVSGNLKQKQTGGITAYVTNDVQPTKFNDLRVTNCLITDVSNSGIRLAPSVWGDNMDKELVEARGLKPFTGTAGDWFGSTNVVIENNYLSNIQGDGIVAAFCDAPLIQYNTVEGAHAADNSDYYAGIWGFWSRDTLIQYNEAYNTRTTYDGQGYDADSGFRTVIQYNYSHDNEGGFMLMIGAGQQYCLDPVIRYNISRNDNEKSALFTHQRAIDAQVYNNTIYVSGRTAVPVQLSGTSGSGVYYNNIFYAGPGANFSDWTRSDLNITYDSNLYFREDGAVFSPSDVHKRTADPLFAAPGTGGTGMDTVGGYQLRMGSPAINAGRDYMANPMVVYNNPYLPKDQINWDRDYFGSPLQNGAPDIGAHEFSAVSYAGAPQLGDPKTTLHTALCDARYWQAQAEGSDAKTALDAAIAAAETAYEGGGGYDAAAATLRAALNVFLAARPTEDADVALPQGAVFDPAAPADIVLRVDWKGNTLAGVYNGESALVPGQYSMTADGGLSIGAAYLSGFTTDQTITVKFSGGADRSVTIPILPAAPAPSISPEAAEFDTYAPGDLAVTLSLQGRTLTGIENGSETLTEGVEYTRSGLTVAIGAGYLQSLSGSQSLRFLFSDGTACLLSVTYKDTNPGHAVENYTQAFETVEDLAKLKVYAGLSTATPLPEDAAPLNLETTAPLSGQGSARLTQPSNGGQYDIILVDPDAPQADSGIYEATFRIAEFSTEVQQIRFLLRFQDTRNYTSLAYASPNKWTVYSKVDGVAGYGPVATPSFTISANTTYRVRIQYEGDIYSLSLFSGSDLSVETKILENKTIATTPNGNIRPFQGAGTVGIFLSSQYGKTVLVDDLSYTPLTAATPDAEVPVRAYTTDGSAPLAIPVTLNGDTITAVSLDGQSLANPGDYTLTADGIALTADGLAKLAAGLNRVKLEFGRSNPVYLSVTKTTGTASAVEEDELLLVAQPAERGDKMLRLTLGTGDRIQKITAAGRVLRPGLDYVASGDVLILTHSYLAALNTPVTLTVTFASGAEDTVAVTISAVADSALAQPDLTFDKGADPDGTADYRITLNGNRLTAVLVNNTRLSAAYYAITPEGVLSLSNAYLKTLNGSYSLTFRFNGGKDLSATLLVSDYIYTVTFDSAGGTPAQTGSRTVLAPDTTVSALPAPPVKTGSRFAGWFTQAEGGASFTVDTVLTGSLTVYAHWTPYGDLPGTVESVSATDGRATVVFRAEDLPVDVMPDDFAVLHTAGGVDSAVTVTRCFYDSALRTAILYFNKLAGAEDRSVTLSVSYAGKTSVCADYDESARSAPGGAFSVYDFEDGDPFADKSGNGHTMVQNGSLPLTVGSQTATGSGSSLRLSGHDRYPEDAAKAPAFDLKSAESFTLALWAKIDADSFVHNSGNLDGILMSHNAASPQIINNNNNGGGVSVGHITDTGVPAQNDSQWHQYVFVKDGAEESGRYKFYLDGVLRYTSGSVSVPQTGAFFVFGRATGGGGFKGNMDDIYLYNSKALSANEIAALCALGGGLDRAGLSEAIAAVEAKVGEFPVLQTAADEARAVLDASGTQAGLDEAEAKLRFLLLGGTYLGLTVQPAPYTSVKEGAVTEALTASAAVYPEGKSVSYTWYRASAADAFDGGTALGTGPSFPLPADLTSGTHYFYCVVGAEGTDMTVRSHVAEVYVREKESKPLRFGVVSDFQVGGEFNGSVHNVQKIKDALNRIIAEAGGIENLDAVVYAGDQEDHGYEAEFAAVADAVRSVIPEDSGVECLYLLGNHEYFGGSNCKDLFRTYHGAEPNSATIVKGYTFLMVSQDASSGYNAKTVAWLREELAKAALRDPEKPIFVSFHIPVANTVYGSMPAWSQTDLQAILDQYPQVVAFSGHSHVPVADERSIYQDRITAVNTGFTAYLEMETNLTEASKPDGYREESQGYLVTVDEETNVTLKRLDFTRGGYLGGDWVLSAPHDGSTFRYTNAQRPGTSPEFPAGAAVTVLPSQTSGRLATISFPQAVVPEGNHVYRYQAEFCVDGAVQVTETFFSDYYKGADSASSLTWTTTKLQPGVTYTVRLCAYDALGEAKGAGAPNGSQPIVSEPFTTAAGGELPPDFLLAFDGDRRNSRLEQNVVVQGNVNYVDGIVGKAAYIHDNSFLTLDYGAHLQNPSAKVTYGESFSVALWLNLRELAGTAPVILSNKNFADGGNNGFALYVKAGGLYLNAKPVNGGRVNGTEDILLAEAATDHWVHLAVTFDRENGRITAYVDGLKTGEYNADLSGGMDGGQSTYIAQSVNGGSNRNNNASQYVHFYLDEFQMVNQVLTPAEVEQLARARAAADQKAVADAKAAVESAAFTANGQDVRTEGDAKRIAEARLGAMELGGVAATVNTVSYTPVLLPEREAADELPGAADDAYHPSTLDDTYKERVPAGTDGAYVFTVTLTRGAAVDTTGELTMVITAPIPEPGQDDDGDIAAVRAAIEDWTFTAPQAEAADEAGAAARVGLILAGLDRRGVATEVNPLEFLPAVAGTETAPRGVDGSFTFTVTLSKGGGTPDTTGVMTLTIVAAAYDGPLHVTGVTVTGPTALYTGGTARYSAFVLPVNATDRTLDWSVSDSAVATIDSATGTLTALSAGGVTVTATATDGSGVSGSLYVTVSVYIPPYVPPVGETTPPSKPDEVPEAPAVNVTSTPGGEVKSTVNQDGSVTYTFQSEEGKQVGYVRVNGLVVKADSYTVPAGESVSLVVVFTDPGTDPTARFGDISALSGQAQEAVRYVVGSGLFGGTGMDTFAPNVSMSRAMFATVLARLYGADTTGYTGSAFTDLPMDSWYGPSVAWAAEMGYVQGVGGSSFAPDSTLTRQELVTLIYRFAQSVGVDTSASAGLSDFSDGAGTASWAVDAMSWAVSIGLIQGRGSSLAPDSAISRAETAILLLRMADLLQPAQ